MELPLPLVSVIVPVFNKVDTVVRTIRSVKVQTLNNLECIIVDDGSTDNPKEIILEEIKDDLRFRYIYQNNRGVAHARNKGIEEAKGILICCLDADDEIKPGFIDVCVKTLEADPSLGLAYTRLEYVSPNGDRGISGWPESYNYDNFLKGQNQVPTCCVFRRELAVRLGGYRQRYAPGGAGSEDADFWLRMGSIGFGGKLASNEALFVYHLGGRVSGDPTYQEVDWRKWHPWVKDKKHPFASVATPSNGMSHLVRQYDEPQISIIIPCSPNHEQYLVDALDSLEAQTFRQWEAIVVCDGFEPTPSLCAAYPYVRFRGGEPPVGTGVARNIGADMARGNYLLFLDADDWLEPECLERLLASSQNNSSIAYCDYNGHAFISEQNALLRLQSDRRLLSYNEKTQEAMIAHRAFDYDCELAQRQPELNAQGEFYIWCLISSLVPKQWHIEVGGFDESMPSWEDYDYWIRLARRGRCFTRAPERLLNYRFYTGTRRESASPATTDSRQLAKNLIQYLHEKFAGEKAMGCTTCGQPRSTPIIPQQMSPQMSPQMAVDETVEVQLVDGNRGDHSITGVITKTFYGYRSDGQTFLMNRADAMAQPRSFRILESVVIQESIGLMLAEPIVELPPPSFDFTSLPGITDVQAGKLGEMGIRSLGGLSMASDEMLLEIFTDRKLKKIREKVDEMLTA